MSIERSKTIVIDGLTYVVNEIPMTAEWPVGDPLERDSETLVIFTDRPTVQQQEEKALKDKLVEKIITIMRLEGEYFNDGECLDLIAELLKEEGYDPFPDEYVHTTESDL
jgi:hypothetical protein